MILFHQFLIVVCWISYSLARFYEFDVHCLNGPDFWCLNQTTENLCNFTDKIIGLCGYSNKRCEVKTGKTILFFNDKSIFVFFS